MAKVGRAAYNASRMRVEKIAAGGTKTIGAAEAGELYLIDGADDVVVTLPPALSGSYFKFMIHANAVGGGKSVIINADTANVLIDGSCMQLDADNSNTLSTSDSSANDKITFGTGCLEGSYVELVSDGTKWVAFGISSGGTLAFGDQ